jgi:hypothetical protein
MVLHVLLFLVGTRADFPIHCLQEQSLGVWQLSLSHTTADRAEIGMSGEQFSLRRKCFLEPGVENKTLTFLPPNIVKDTEGNEGTWTMIDDQGWEAQIDGRVYFQFAHFQTKPNSSVPVATTNVQADADDDSISFATKNITSYCGASLPLHAWFHDAASPGEEPTNWGCYSATLIKPLSNNQMPATRTHPVAERGESETLGLPLSDLWMQERPRAVTDHRSDERKYSGLPDAFDWEVRSM